MATESVQIVATGTQSLQCQGRNWSTTKEANENTPTVEAGLQASTFITEAVEAFVAFNTGSVLPSGAVIVEASIDIDITNIISPSGHFWSVIGYQWDWGASLTGSDWAAGTVLNGTGPPLSTPAICSRFSTQMTESVVTFPIGSNAFPLIETTGVTRMVFATSDIGTDAPEPPPSQNGITFASGSVMTVRYQTTNPLATSLGINF